jgi:hypothetical protein
MGLDCLTGKHFSPVRVLKSRVVLQLVDALLESAMIHHPVWSYHPQSITVLQESGTVVPPQYSSCRMWMTGSVTASRGVR